MFSGRFPQFLSLPDFRLFQPAWPIINNAGTLPLKTSGNNLLGKAAYETYIWIYITVVCIHIILYIKGQHNLLMWLSWSLRCTEKALKCIRARGEVHVWLLEVPGLQLLSASGSPSNGVVWEFLNKYNWYSHVPRPSFQGYGNWSFY